MLCWHREDSGGCSFGGCSFGDDEHWWIWGETDKYLLKNSADAMHRWDIYWSAASPSLGINREIC
jgi:hypothetical protein